VSFITDDFLLSTPAARRLYHEYAAAEPILDYHCHLPPRDIAENRMFANLYEIWLEGDHYKWRAMRANGVDESYCTGDAPPRDKFLAWARTVPCTLRNPLYHWTHLELKRYFGIDDLLDEKTAPRIWDEANALLATDDLRTQGILRSFGVVALCTTDDPTDTPWTSQGTGFPTNVFPAFRPDKALNVRNPEAFRAWIDRLEAAADTTIGNFSSFLDAIRKRHDHFHSLGARLSDHGINHCFAEPCSEAEAAAIFDQARDGRVASPEDHARYASFMMLFFGHLDAEKGWTKQLHLGAYRNASTRMLERAGSDIGFDSMGDWPQINALGAYLDRLSRENALPKMILYNVNPRDNYPLASMCGNFQIQFGSAWWFLDQKEGMELQINALSNCGLLSRFIGMLTDSRSFMSYPRHEYFRRVLCNLLGRDIENGELPSDYELVGGMVRNICYANALNYLELPIQNSSTAIRPSVLKSSPVAF
jgi:glucuronate isomerase